MAIHQLGFHSLVTSSQRDALARLRQRYDVMGERARSEFLLRYGSFKTADELFQAWPAEVEHVLVRTVQAAAIDAAAGRIYDLDEATLRADLASRTSEFSGPAERAEDAYYSILGKAAELEAQREEARENRGRIIGGGFGIEGAAQGIAAATVANAAIGLAHGLVNLTAKAAGALGDGKKKRELLADPGTRADLAEFLYRLTLEGYRLVADVTNAAEEEARYETISSDAERKAMALVENVRRERVPAEDIAPALIRALELDPFQSEIWVTWIDRFGDSDGSVARSADELGVSEAGRHTARTFEEKRAALRWVTSAECRNSIPELAATAGRLGLPFEEERIRLESLADDLDRRERSYNGVVYPSPAEADIARHNDAAAREQEAARQQAEAATAAEALTRTFDGVEYQTHEECAQARRKHNRKAIPFIVGILVLAVAWAIFLRPRPAPQPNDTVVAPAPAALPAATNTAGPVATAVATDTLPSEAAGEQFNCIGTYGNVSFSEESGDGSGLVVKILSPEKIRLDSWEGGVFHSKVSVLKREGPTLRLRLAFEEFTENSQVTLTCQGSNVIVEGPNWGRQTLRQLTAKQAAELETD